MNNINRLLIFLSVFILGCSPSIIKENKVIQNIDTLDMNIFSKEGEKIYSIRSPNSKYDNIQLKFNLKRTTINIYDGEDVKYVINSDSSTISNNNTNYDFYCHICKHCRDTFKKDDILHYNFIKDCKIYIYDKYYYEIYY